MHPTSTQGKRFSRVIRGYKNQRYESSEVRWRRGSASQPLELFAGLCFHLLEYFVYIDLFI